MAILYWATSESIWDPPVLTAVIFCGGIYHIPVSWQRNLQYYCIVHDQIWVSGEFSRERLAVSHLHTCLSIIYLVYIDCLWRPPVFVIQYASYKMMPSFRTIFLTWICYTAFTTNWRLLLRSGRFLWRALGLYYLSFRSIPEASLTGLPELCFCYCAAAHWKQSFGIPNRISRKPKQVLQMGIIINEMFCSCVVISGTSLPLSSGVAGPTAHGAFTCLQLSHCGLPAGRHQEDTAGPRRTRSAGEVSFVWTVLSSYRMVVHSK